MIWSRHTFFKIDDRYYMEKLKKEGGIKPSHNPVELYRVN